MLFYIGLFQPALFLGLKEFFQFGNKDQADQRGGEAAVIQAEAAVEGGNMQKWIIAARQP